MLFFNSLHFFKACESSAFLVELPGAATQFINMDLWKTGLYQDQEIT